MQMQADEQKLMKKSTNGEMQKRKRKIQLMQKQLRRSNRLQQLPPPLICTATVDDGGEKLKI